MVREMAQLYGIWRRELTRFMLNAVLLSSKWSRADAPRWYTCTIERNGFYKSALVT